MGNKVNVVFKEEKMEYFQDEGYLRQMINGYEYITGLPRP